MTRVDLDNAEKAAGQLHEDTAELIWALVAELRAAREVVEAVGVSAFLVALADFIVSTDGGYGRFGSEIPESLRQLAFAKAAYDQVVGA